jgi:ABC-type bacteriocin/lantibiotic exporter with double-glycine peptidase domain
MTPWQRLLNLMKLEQKDIYKILLYAAFSGLVGLALPLGVQAVINLVVGGQFNASIIILISLVLLSVIFQGIIRYMQLRVAEDLQQRIYARSSFELIYRFPRMQAQALDGKYAPELANRFFDTITIQKGLPKAVIDFSEALLQIIFGLILLSFYHPFFIFFGVLLVFLLYVVFQFTIPKGISTSLIESKMKYKTAHWIEEVARNFESFKVIDSYTLSTKKNDNLVSKYLDARENHFQILKIQFFKMIGFKTLVTAGLLIIGGLLVINQQMNIGQFVAAEIVILLMISSVEKLILGLENVYDVITSTEKIGQVTDIPLDKDSPNKPLSKDDDFTLELNNLSVEFQESQKRVLDNINLIINQNEKILLDGPSGSGKTTLLKVIAGLVIKCDGQLLVNNINTLNINNKHYRSFIGFVFPTNSPFDGTIRENITFNNPEMPEERIKEVCHVLGIDSFIKTLPEGLETHITTDGRQLSYTMSRKLVIARALIIKPKVLILKDPLDEFDDHEIDKITRYIFDEKHNWTVMVASKNQIWSKYCNRIIKLDNGKLV